ncbi:pro-sigmaK processing inhibitor BofA family protein [Ruminococcus bromii]|uniref:pro-sigmaK processing inhibitor BofA family protein n=1 Tax=Ruminococcus bromii TaxID=40518 RepID=UPI00241C59EE|nr:pro-sigmaK processing inhibitor BofA family protein [Ruminococcus bromii]
MELFKMPWWGICLIIFSTFLIFAVLHYIGKSKHPFKRSALSMAIGTLTLFAVNLTGTFTGVTLPISTLSLLVSAIGGIPGVTLMLGLNLFF